MKAISSVAVPVLLVFFRAEGAPATQPAAAQATSTVISFAPPPAILPRDYAILNTRSIFYKGAGPVPGSSESVAAGAFPTSQESAAAASEQTLVFNGMAETEDGSVAFIENTSSHQVLVVQVGQALAGGKVAGVSLHELTYETAAGKTIRVEIGHNLAGMAVAASTQPVVVGTSSSSQAPSSPPTGSEDILDRLRKRHDQELNGK